MKNFDFNNGIFFGCAEMQQVMNQFPQTDGTGLLNISGGLKEALNNGISKQVTKLTTDGFKNEAVKILLPEELRKWMQD
jgi:hypothetical protein